MAQWEEDDPLKERFSQKIILRNIVIAFIIGVYFFIFLITLFDI